MDWYLTYTAYFAPTRLLALLYMLVGSVQRIFGLWRKVINIFAELIEVLTKPTTHLLNDDSFFSLVKQPAAQKIVIKGWKPHHDFYWITWNYHQRDPVMNN